MTRLWSLLAFVILALLTPLLLWLNTAPADDTSLQSLLLPPDCANPCFIGLQPGVTTFPEARALLENHQWVMDVELVFRAPNTPLEIRNGTLRWRWNGRQPALLRTPFLEAGEIAIEDGLVHSVKVATAIPFGDAWLLLGAPPHGFIGTSRTYLERFYNHHAVYSDYGIRLRTLLPNPFHIDAFWNTAVEIIFEAAPNERNHYRLPCWLRCE